MLTFQHVAREELLVTCATRDTSPVLTKISLLPPSVTLNTSLPSVTLHSVTLGTSNVCQHDAVSAHFQCISFERRHAPLFRFSDRVTLHYSASRTAARSIILHLRPRHHQLSRFSDRVKLEILSRVTKFMNDPQLVA